MTDKSECRHPREREGGREGASRRLNPPPLQTLSSSSLSRVARRIGEEKKNKEYIRIMRGPAGALIKNVLLLLLLLLLSLLLSFQRYLTGYNYKTCSVAGK